MAWQYYHTVWLVLGIGWISLYIVRMAVAPLLGMIMEEFQISHAAAGALFSAILYSYTFLQIPSGFLGDRFGRRKILLLGTCAWFILTLATSLAGSFAALFAARVLTGIAQGVYFGNERPTIIAFTPPEKMAQGQGLSFAGLAAGFFLGVALSGVVAQCLGGWRWVFVVFSIPSLITVFLIYKYIRVPPRPYPQAAPVRVASAFREALGSRDLWLMYLAGCAVLYGYWTVATWMPSIFRDAGVEGVLAGSLLAGMLGLIGIPGLLIAGKLSDSAAQKGHPRKGIISLCLFIWAALMAAMGFAVQVRAPGIWISVLFLSSGLIVFGVWAPYYALLGELAPPRIVGTVFGLANFIGFVSAWVAPSLTGWIKDATGSFSGGLYLAGLLLATGAVLMLAVGRPGRGSAVAPN